MTAQSAYIANDFGDLARGPSIDRVTVGTCVMPARRSPTGGDWCESFAISDRIVALSIGDVCGHGPIPHPAMIAIRDAIRGAARADATPALTLARANRFVCELDPELHATALFALLDVEAGTLSFASAGHPPPLLVGIFGARYLASGVADLPLGIDSDGSFVGRHADIAADSLLVLYTDGVTEHARRPLCGARDLRDAGLAAFGHRTAACAYAIADAIFIRGSNYDDASILTAYVSPLKIQRRAPRF